MRDGMLKSGSHQAVFDKQTIASISSSIPQVRVEYQYIQHKLRLLET